ncbi:hypothetical protein MCOL2_01245 [Listeria fleischmannii FSL S10-1203]|uniref:Uncharacterized protein n=1 Tax=Listeria fleischmannii FSL S10-1203 TaxID=1265822 RepID=W7DSD9_9LIST|nr:hypothetical protein MCOL2_01245 [Listeria fleischmannii FSL S10-1203]
MKKLTAQQKTLVIIGIILMIAVTIFGIIWNNQLATVIILGVVQFVLIQAVCYVGIYSQMKVGTSRGTKLFSWGILTTILFVSHHRDFCT